MTRYLLDTNIFIQAKNWHYGFDFCPAFWEWLLVQNEAGKVASIENVRGELRKYKPPDALSEWVDQDGRGLFLPRDNAVEAALGQISIWVNGQNYKRGAINGFLKAADYWLVAYALAHDFTIVTHEVSSKSIRRIKIPDACKGLGIGNASPYEMLRCEGARFVLDGATRRSG